MMLYFRQVLMSRVILLFTLSCFCLNVTVSAAILTTTQTVNPKVKSFYSDININREDLEKKLISLGVTQQQVQSRLDSMTDSEIAMISSDLSKLPAGGDALTTIALVFLVLLFTDIAGYTDLFPFVKKNSRTTNDSSHDGKVIDRRVTRDRKEPVVIEN